MAKCGGVWRISEKYQKLENIKEGVTSGISKQWRQLVVTL